MIVVKNVRPLRLFRINGIVLWPFLFYADADPNPIIRNHEEIHLEQLRQKGIMKFYFQYLAEYFQGRLKGLKHDEAYRNISFEREAYTHQGNESYLAELRKVDRISPRNNQSHG